MTAQSPSQKLLQSLFESSLVKAAAIVTHGGKVRDRIGQASVFHTKSRAGQSEKPSENVYLVELATLDMLLVVFDEHVEFERLRKSVDTLLTHYQLEKPREKKEEKKRNA